METRRLEAFKMLVEKGSFRLAAEALFISQPALSQQIGRLEEEMGARLIDRSVRPFGLTPAGNEFHVRIRRVLDEVGDLEALFEQTRRGETGRIRLGLVPSLLYGDMPAMIKEFVDRRPGVKIDIVHEHTMQLREMLESGRLDVVMLFTEPAIKELTCRELYAEAYIAAVNSDHRLAGEKTISFSQLRGESLITVPRSVAPENHDALVAACMHAGFSPRGFDTPGSYLDHVGLTSAGLGVSLIPVSLSGLHMKNVVYIPLVKPEVKAVVSVCWFDQRVDLASKLFIEYCLEYYVGLPDSTDNPTEPVSSQERPGAQNRREMDRK